MPTMEQIANNSRNTQQATFQRREYENRNSSSNQQEFHGGFFEDRVGAGPSNSEGAPYNNGQSSNNYRNDKSQQHSNNRSSFHDRGTKIEDMVYVDEEYDDTCLIDNAPNAILMNRQEDQRPVSAAHFKYDTQHRTDAQATHYSGASQYPMEQRQNTSTCLTANDSFRPTPLLNTQEAATFRIVSQNELETFTGARGQCSATWLYKLEQLVRYYKWSQQEKFRQMFAKLGKRPKKLFSTFELPAQYHLAKNKFMIMYPSDRNYHLLLTKMVYCVKRPQNSIQEYYYKKLDFLKKCGITNTEDMVSCFIGGIKPKFIRNKFRNYMVTDLVSFRDALFECFKTI